MSTVFTIQTAVKAAPTGYYFETQIERPGQLWKSWKTGRTNTFTPDAGPGIYSFRAHLVRKSNGASAGWSPVASITVT